MWLHWNYQNKVIDIYMQRIIYSDFYFGFVQECAMCAHDVKISFHMMISLATDSHTVYVKLKLTNYELRLATFLYSLASVHG